MLSKSQLKYIQSLGHKKRRDEDGVFIAEGPKIVDELLSEKNLFVKEIFAVKDWKTVHPNIPVTEISEQDLEKISQMNTPNQVFCIANKIKWNGEPILKGTLSLALDTIQDPGNLGTIIRTADWFGIRQIFCSKDCADVYNPKVVQSTMGSIARVRIEYNDLDSFFSQYPDTRIYAATLDGRPVHKMEKPTEGVILIGNESKGISDSLLKKINVRITIPGKGKAESLNAAVATGIILSHLT